MTDDTTVTARQPVLVVPDYHCENCRSLLAGIGYEHPQGKRNCLIVCESCLPFLMRMESDKR